MQRRRAVLKGVLVAALVWLALAAILDRHGDVNWLFLAFYGAWGLAALVDFLRCRRRRTRGGEIHDSG